MNQYLAEEEEDRVLPIIGIKYKIECPFCGSCKRLKNNVYHLSCLKAHDKKQTLLFYKEFSLLVASTLSN
jgi:hypothetical protein